MTLVTSWGNKNMHEMQYMKYKEMLLVVKCMSKCRSKGDFRKPQQAA